MQAFGMDKPVIWLPCLIFSVWISIFDKGISTINDWLQTLLHESPYYFHFESIWIQ